MASIGGRADDYNAETSALVESTCLTIAQILGNDLLEQTVIVGGLVPTLLYKDVKPTPEIGRHVGTTDVDLALDLVVLEDAVYETIEERFRDAGFQPDHNEKGNLTRHRWRPPNGPPIDFLMPLSGEDARPGRLQNLTAELAAIMMRGLDLALSQRIWINLDGEDLQGRRVARRLPICAPHVFVALKALAFANRNKNKDPYDIYFVLKHDPTRPHELGARLTQFAGNEAIQMAIDSLTRDHSAVRGRGPRSVCDFLGKGSDDAFAGDVLAQVLSFLDGFHGRGIPG